MVLLGEWFWAWKTVLEGQGRMNRPRIMKAETKNRSFLWLSGLSLVMCAAGMLCLSCGSSGSPSSTSQGPPSVAIPLMVTDVSNVVQNAIMSVNAPMVVAVVDRAGKILAVFKTDQAPDMSTGNFRQMVKSDELAVALARTAAFFSNDMAPLSSRTVRFISGIHFPPGVPNTPNADLYGIENTNRGCTLNSVLPGKGLSPSRSIDESTTSLGIITGKADVKDSDPLAVNPGGVPLFNGGVVGGVGVVSSTPEISEYAAFTAATSFGTLAQFISDLPPPGVVIIGGIAVPFVKQTSLPSGSSPGPFPGAGSYEDPTAYPMAGSLPPEGYLVGPNSSTELSASDVDNVISNAVATAKVTRAVIRLPVNSPTAMTIAVSDLKGNLLGLYRMHDGTVFSVDVAASKARNVVWFTTIGVADLPGVPTGTAVTNRTISFGAQPLFPPGIDASGNGPFFPLYEYDTTHPCTQGTLSGPPNANTSGVVFFPGSVPLYRNGALVGGLGVSGDGVDQDDFVTAGAINGACGMGGPCGAPDLQAPANIRADQVVIENVRLPYQKFPRNPTK
jgi:uncharacterized protein GlcG (DUF336 family)